MTPWRRSKLYAAMEKIPGFAWRPRLRHPYPANRATAFRLAADGGAGLHDGRAAGTARILPMSDDPVATVIRTEAGELAFQDYFVRRHHTDEVLGVRFAGIEDATISEEVRREIRTPTRSSSAHLTQSSVLGRFSRCRACGNYFARRPRPSSPSAQLCPGMRCEAQQIECLLDSATNHPQLPLPRSIEIS